MKAKEEEEKKAQREPKEITAFNEGARKKIKVPRRLSNRNINFSGRN